MASINKFFEASKAIGASCVLSMGIGAAIAQDVNTLIGDQDNNTPIVRGSKKIYIAPIMQEFLEPNIGSQFTSSDNGKYIFVGNNILVSLQGGKYLIARGKVGFPNVQYVGPNGERYTHNPITDIIDLDDSSRQDKYLDISTGELTDFSPGIVHLPITVQNSSKPGTPYTSNNIQTFLKALAMSRELNVIKVLDHFKTNERGVMVTSIDINSAQPIQNLRVGDKIVTFNGYPINNIEDLARIVYELKPGVASSIFIERNGKIKEVFFSNTNFTSNVSSKIQDIIDKLGTENRKR